MKVITQVEFTPEEKHAIIVLSNIDCSSFFCKQCPLHLERYDNGICLRDKMVDLSKYFAEKCC